MPITPVPLAQPTVTTVPHLVPPSQRLVPVEPAKRVTAARHGGRADIDPDEKRRHSQGDHSGDRGATLDVEV